MTISKPKIVVLFLAASSLVACQQKTANNLMLESKQPAPQMMETLMHNMQKCWFKNNEADFKPYLLAPELRSYSNKPRLLLVDAKTPSERPLLVVEASHTNAKIMAYGPLMNSNLGNKIAKDLNNWTHGNDICQK